MVSNFDKFIRKAKSFYPPGSRVNLVSKKLTWGHLKIFFIFLNEIKRICVLPYDFRQFVSVKSLFQERRPQKRRFCFEKKSA